MSPRLVYSSTNTLTNTTIAFFSGHTSMTAAFTLAWRVPRYALTRTTLSITLLHSITYIYYHTQRKGITEY